MEKLTELKKKRDEISKEVEIINNKLVGSLKLQLKKTQEEFRNELNLLQMRIRTNKALRFIDEKIFSEKLSVYKQEGFDIRDKFNDKLRKIEEEISKTISENFMKPEMVKKRQLLRDLNDIELRIKYEEETLKIENSDTYKRKLENIEKIKYLRNNVH